ncbi:hypothetical protein PtrSN002B_011982, partial [Pyrenophora tritici-repentis]
MRLPLRNPPPKIFCLSNARFNVFKEAKEGGFAGGHIDVLKFFGSFLIWSVWIGK